jgi:hypothetical protein
MSLRSDISFIARTLGEAIRQILGETFRVLADTLLQKQEPVVDPQAPPIAPIRVETPHTRTRKAIRAVASNPEPLPDSDPIEKPIRIRDRSMYVPKDHGSFKISAIAILKVFLQGEGQRLSVPELHKILEETSSESTIRTSCKTMVEDHILGTIREEGARSAMYWVIDEKAARQYLAQLEAVAPKLPTSDESGEPQASLN